MSGKLALVVDDSKSARVVLRRMLEKHAISVDTAESASDAFDYLDRRRPDVIFMDHMMPGMDGFEAVKRIKADPRTVTIPVMMYTSKGGDLYLGQARALGAVGILPKTVAPTELYDALLRLGLTTDRRTHTAPSNDEDGASERANDLNRRASEDWAIVDEPMPVRNHAARPEDEHLRSLLEEQRVELRKDLLVSIDSVTRNVSTRMNQDIDDKLENLKSSLPKPRSLALPLGILSMLLIPLVIWNLSLQNKLTRLTDKLALQSNLPSKIAVETIAPKAVAKPDKDTSNDTSEIEQWAKKQTLEYPFNELALDHDRLNSVDNMLGRLLTANFRGRVTLATHTGVFCMNGSTESGFELAPDDAPITQCSYIGNPVQPTDLPASHQSLRFANFLSALKAENGIIVNVQAMPRTVPLFPYPEKTGETKAGEWNKAASQNNRVLVRLEPFE
ncbi:MAG: response regulator [Gammaproteobacteria bacterium]